MSASRSAREDVPTHPAPMPMSRGCPFDPPEEYRGLRDTDPIHQILLPTGDHGWLITRFDTVRQVLSDPRFSHRNDLIEPPVPPKPAVEWVPTPPGRGDFNMMDAPEHTNYRRILARYFTSRRVERLADRIAVLAHEQVDHLLEVGCGADLVAEYAAPLAGRAICELLGVDENERSSLQHDIDTIFCLSVDVQLAYRSIMNIGEAVHRIVDRAVASGGQGLTAAGDPDVLSELITRDELDIDELRSITGILIVGGMDTTANMLDIGALALMRDRQQLELFRTGGTNVQVDELLRWLTISHWGASRRALADVVIGGDVNGRSGQLIREGELVVLALNSANRDAGVFADADKLDLTRPAMSHLAFGHGAHLCIGHHLARVTLRAGWTTLFARIPDLQVDPLAPELRMRDNMTHYGVHELPVTWGCTT